MFTGLKDPNVTLYREGLMTIGVEDMAGHFSKAVSFSIQIEAAGAQQAPTQGVFEEKNCWDRILTQNQDRIKGRS